MDYLVILLGEPSQQPIWGMTAFLLFVNCEKRATLPHGFFTSVIDKPQLFFPFETKWNAMIFGKMLIISNEKRGVLHTLHIFL